MPRMIAMHTPKLPTARCPKCSRTVELEDFRPADGKAKYDCGYKFTPDRVVLVAAGCVAEKYFGGGRKGASRMVKSFKHEDKQGWFVADDPTRPAHS